MAKNESSWALHQASSRNINMFVRFTSMQFLLALTWHCIEWLRSGRSQLHYPARKCFCSISINIPYAPKGHSLSPCANGLQHGEAGMTHTPEMRKNLVNFFAFCCMFNS